MPKFRKKPVVIEAIQFTGAPESFAEILAWVGGDALIDMDTPSGNPHLYIRTIEGTMWARPSDWVIKGIQGEFYPCKTDIFEATYESVGPIDG